MKARGPRLVSLKGAAVNPARRQSKHEVPVHSPRWRQLNSLCSDCAQWTDGSWMKSSVRITPDCWRSCLICLCSAFRRRTNFAISQEPPPVRIATALTRVASAGTARHPRFSHCPTGRRPCCPTYGPRSFAFLHLPSAAGARVCAWAAWRRIRWWRLWWERVGWEVRWFPDARSTTGRLLHHHPVMNSEKLPGDVDVDDDVVVGCRWDLGHDPAPSLDAPQPCCSAHRRLRLYAQNSHRSTWIR